MVQKAEGKNALAPESEKIGIDIKSGTSGYQRLKLITKI